MNQHDRDDDKDSCETDFEYRQRKMREHKQNGLRTPIGHGYVGYHGSVDEQPDNPQNRYTDDD